MGRLNTGVNKSHISAVQLKDELPNRHINLNRSEALLKIQQISRPRTSIKTKDEHDFSNHALMMEAESVIPQTQEKTFSIENYAFDTNSTFTANEPYDYGSLCLKHFTHRSNNIQVSELARFFQVIQTRLDGIWTQMFKTLKEQNLYNNAKEFQAKETIAHKDGDKQ